MDIDERLERLTGIVESLASPVVDHDSRMERLTHLIQLAEKQPTQTGNLSEK